MSWQRDVSKNKLGTLFKLLACVGIFLIAATVIKGLIAHQSATAKNTMTKPVIIEIASHGASAMHAAWTFVMIVMSLALNAPNDIVENALVCCVARTVAE